MLSNLQWLNLTKLLNANKNEKQETSSSYIVTSHIVHMHDPEASRLVISNSPSYFLFWLQVQAVFVFFFSESILISYSHDLIYKYSKKNIIYLFVLDINYKTINTNGLKTLYIAQVLLLANKKPKTSAEFCTSCVCWYCMAQNICKL